MAAEEARFSIPIDSNYEQAEQAARALEELRRKISGGTDKLKDMQAAYKRLTGDTADVLKAKVQLTAQIDAEKNAISAAQLKLNGMGVSYEKLAQRTKRAGDEQKKLGDKLKADDAGKAATGAKGLGLAISSAGGPVANLKAKFDRLKEVGGKGGVLGILAMGIAGLIAAAVALAVALGKSVFDLGKFIVSGANAARSADLLREGVTGSAEDAQRLGQQVDALARKLPTAKAQINEMAVSLRKAGLSGQTLVDTMNAVGQASAAVGDEAGAKLRELAERGKLTNRFQIAPLEMVGTGVDFDDIAKALASQMRIGVDKARRALVEGRVKLADGAAAMRQAVEDKFGGLNLRKMMDLDVAFEKFKETVFGFANEVDLEPFLRGLKLIGSAFDTSTTTGHAMKSIVTMLGNAISTTFEKGAPLVKRFIQGMVLGVLMLTVQVLKLRKQWRETMGDKEIIKGATLITLAVKAGTLAFSGLAVTVLWLSGMLAMLGGALNVVAGAWHLLEAAWAAGKQALTETDWAATGRAIVDGIISGLTSGAGRLVDAVKGLAKKITGTFTSKLEIRSPSKVFARHGESIPDGVAEGIDSGAPKAAAAIDGMAPMPGAGGSASGSAAGGGGGGPISVTINAPGATKEAVDAMGSDDFLQNLVKALRDAKSGGGMVPT